MTVRPRGREASVWSLSLSLSFSVSLCLCLSLSPSRPLSRSLKMSDSISTRADRCVLKRELWLTYSIHLFENGCLCECECVCVCVCVCVCLCVSSSHNGLSAILLSALLLVPLFSPLAEKIFLERKTYLADRSCLEHLPRFLGCSQT